MTLMDLFRLIRRYWIVVVAATLVCGGAAGMYAKTSQSLAHSATAAVVGNSQVGGVMGFASAESRALVGANSDYGVEVKTETGTNTVNITVTGPKEEECIALANEVADRTLKRAIQAYENFENPFSGAIEKADATVEIKSGGGMKYLLVGILAGLFLGVCVVVIIDMVRRPIKSVEGMQDLVELPVLEKLPAENGERLLANVRFASKIDDLKRVCVVPLGDIALAEDVAVLLHSAMAAEGQSANKLATAADEALRDSFFAQACAPLSKNMSAAYESRGADAAIVVGRQWDDSLTSLEATVAELKLAGTNVAGLVFAQKK